MAVVLALITSVLWGTGDFFGGLATRRDPVTRVMLWAHGVGLVAIAIAAPFLSDSFIFRDLVLGALAIAVIVMGVWPAPLLEVMGPTIDNLVTQLMQSKL